MRVTGGNEKERRGGGGGRDWGPLAVQDVPPLASGQPQHVLRRTVWKTVCRMSAGHEPLDIGSVWFTPVPWFSVVHTY